MDITSNSKVMMDFVRLETEVRQKAQEYLDDISEANLKAFAESTKYVAQFWKTISFLLMTSTLTVL